MAISVELESPTIPRKGTFIFAEDPVVRAKRRRLAALKKALRKKDWDTQKTAVVAEVPLTAPPPTEPSSPEPPPIAPVAAAEPERWYNNAAVILKAIVFALFTLFRKTASFINQNLITPIRRGTYAILNYVIQPVIDGIFGEIDYGDTYDKAGKELRVEISVPVKQSEISATPNSTDPQATPEVIFSRAICDCNAPNSVGASTYMTFESRISTSHGSVTFASASASSFNTAKPRVN